MPSPIKKRLVCEPLIVFLFNGTDDASSTPISLKKIGYVLFENSRIRPLV
jgi:hypothetical protein